MEGRLLEGYKDPEVIERNITKLSNLKAISIIYDGTYSTLGNDFRMRQWSMITQKEGVIYPITCVDTEDQFSQSLPLFRKLMSSFLIFP